MFRRIFLTLTAFTVFLAGPALAAKSSSPARTKTETAILSGGCFWGMEEVFRKVPGVVSTEVGYTGGTLPYPTYEDVSSGTTGHAESIRIQFDPQKISYEDLLKTYFRMHNPTTPNRQGNDRGTQYRSEIFYLNPAQKSTAQKVIKLVDQSKKWGAPVVTQLEPAKTFYRAEEYHQKYLVKNPDGYNDHYLRNFHF
jgi:peptide methionine sulfoxide reductase msrA/msrB